MVEEKIEQWDEKRVKVEEMVVERVRRKMTAAKRKEATLWSRFDRG